MQMETKKKSLAECFSDLINPAPASFDPEDDIYLDTVAKVVENEVEFSDEERSLNASRKRRLDFVEECNERYDGAKIPRKALNTGRGDADEELEVGNEASAGTEDSCTSEDESVESQEYCHNEMNRNTVLELEYDDEGNIFQHISSRSMETEVEKAVAVRNQLNLWDTLLQCRIKLQKTLTAANKLPQCNIFEHFITQGGSKFKVEIRRTKHMVATLLGNLLAFQTKMLKSYPETRNLNKTTAECPIHEVDEISSDTGEEEANEASDNVQEQKELNTKSQSLEHYAELISHNHKKYSQYRNAVIQKWNDRTRVLVGKVSSHNFSTFEQSTLKQIEHILSNRQRLIQRSQLKRSSYIILGQELIPQEQTNTEGSVAFTNADNFKTGQEECKEYNTEIYDDTDYYHQLLRELIERKSSDITDPVQLGRQWLELQKLRSKMKRKIDTRATKGRKIRYVVHSKLVNYMAPVSQSLFTEEAKTELFNSLFGKGSGQ